LGYETVDLTALRSDSLLDHQWVGRLVAEMVVLLELDWVAKSVVELVATKAVDLAEMSVVYSVDQKVGQSVAERVVHLA